jgi:hypothetical protein
MSDSAIANNEGDSLANIVPTQIPGRIFEFDNTFIIEDDIGFDSIWPLRPDNFPYLFQCQCHDVFDM